MKNIIPQKGSKIAKRIRRCLQKVNSNSSEFYFSFTIVISTEAQGLFI